MTAALAFSVLSKESSGIRSCSSTLTSVARACPVIRSTGAASVGNRAPPHGGGASGGALPSARDDDGGEFMRDGGASQRMRVGHDLIPGAVISGGDGGVGVVPERRVAGDALFDGEI